MTFKNIFEKNSHGDHSHLLVAQPLQPVAAGFPQRLRSVRKHFFTRNTFLGNFYGLHFLEVPGPPKDPWCAARFRVFRVMINFGKRSDWKR